MINNFILLPISLADEPPLILVNDPSLDRVGDLNGFQFGNRAELTIIKNPDFVDSLDTLDLNNSDLIFEFPTSDGKFCRYQFNTDASPSYETFQRTSNQIEFKAPFFENLLDRCGPTVKYSNVEGKTNGKLYVFDQELQLDSIISDNRSDFGIYEEIAAIELIDIKLLPYLDEFINLNPKEPNDSSIIENSTTIDFRIKNYQNLKSVILNITGDEFVDAEEGCQIEIPVTPSNANWFNNTDPELFRLNFNFTDLSGGCMGNPGEDGQFQNSSLNISEGYTTLLKEVNHTIEVTFEFLNGQYLNGQDFTFLGIERPDDLTNVISGQYIFGGFNGNHSIMSKIESSDPGFPMDYSSVNSVIYEISYFETVSNRSTNTLSTCHVSGFFELNSTQIILFPIDTNSILESCPDYHQVTTNRGRLPAPLKIFLMLEGDYVGVDSMHSFAQVNEQLIYDEIGVEGINIAPSIISNLEIRDYRQGETISVTVANKINITRVGITIDPNNLSCWIRISNDDLVWTPIDPTLMSLSDYLLTFNLPTRSTIDETCNSDDVPVGSRVNLDSNYFSRIYIEDDYYEAENDLEINLIANTSSGVQVSFSGGGSIPAPPVAISPVVELPPARPVIIPKVDLPVTVIESPAPEVALKTWCDKKGIWVFTKSGKLRMCDPVNKIAIEVQACTGKAETPTYPWIYKPQRFVIGKSPTKSGTPLFNAVFFYKGLAISGSNNVSSEPCSKGSVFVPMKYSKTILNFAKQQNPTIWVKER